MPRRSDAKERMVRSAARLISVRGVDGTSFADVVADSGAPRGSIYHHFRDGKRQLAEEAIRWSGEFILAGTAAALERDDPVAAIEVLRTQWTDILRGSDFLAGCTIVAAALEGAREPRVRDTAAAVFGTWERVLTEALRRRG